MVCQLLNACSKALTNKNERCRKLMTCAVPPIKQWYKSLQVCAVSMATEHGRLALVNSMWITGTITTKQKVRQNVPGLYAVCR